MEKTPRRLPVVERDAWLQPVEEHMNRRYAQYERQMARVEVAAPRRRAADKQAKPAPVGPCEPLCGALEQAEGNDPARGVEAETEPLSKDLRGAAIGLPPKPSEAGSVGKGGAAE